MSGKVKYQSLSEYQKKKYLGEFYSMVSMLRGRDEVKLFFKDLLTLSETVMISRRIQIARMLLEGKTYAEIRSELKTGFSTINQVERWLNNGFGGYQRILKKYNEGEQAKKHHKAKNFSWYEASSSFGDIRKKYPLHFFLLNLVAGKGKK